MCHLRSGRRETDWAFCRPIPTASSLLLLRVSSKRYSTTGHHLGSIVFFSITPAVDTLARHYELLSIFCARRQRSKARASRETSDCPVASGAIGIVTLKNRTTPWPPAVAGSRLKSTITNQ